jgi:alkaline phosphatase D
MTADHDADQRIGAGGLTRREALLMTLAAGVTATSITLAVEGAEAAAGAAPFLHGVASGDPLADRVILWTRVTRPGVAGDLPVDWIVAEDEAFTRVVRRGTSLALADRDHTLKLDITRLSPGTTYYYRFEQGGLPSQVGRTKTLPVGAVDRLRFMVFSCSNFELGFFNAYREAARYKDVDAVLHLGDYIYEYGRGPSGYTTPATGAGLLPKPRDHALQPREEIVTLDQYRARHALYRTDAFLRNLHALFPFINVWDDHEVANDAWTGGAENHTTPAEGAWAVRKRLGIRAFYEWLPIREPQDGVRVDPVTGNPDSVYRSFDFGDLARLVMLDTRQAGRDEPLPQDRLIGAYVGAPPQGPFPKDVREDGKSRTLLGDAQAAWVDDQITTSTQIWQLIGNQVLMFYQNAPEVAGSAVVSNVQKLAYNQVLDRLFGAGTSQTLAQLGAAGLPTPLAADAWTGYPTARIRMLNTLAKAKNPVVLTGDSHNAWTANLVLPTPAGPKPVAAEFGGTSVSSPGTEQYLLGIPPEATAALQVDSSARKSPVDKLIYTEQSRRGFMMVDVRRTGMLVDHVFVSSVFGSSYSVERKRFQVRVNSRRAIALTS